MNANDQRDALVGTNIAATRWAHPPHPFARRADYILRHAVDIVHAYNCYGPLEEDMALTTE